MNSIEMAMDFLKTMYQDADSPRYWEIEDRLPDEIKFIVNQHGHETRWGAIWHEVYEVSYPDMEKFFIAAEVELPGNYDSGGEDTFYGIVKMKAVETINYELADE